mgnify:CR=1 FL=1
MKVASDLSLFALLSKNLTLALLWLLQSGELMIVIF